ncbi:MFS transporter [Chitinilyticum piscinae]|uniref:MFS transporter n=1 Tax=Chitinilyticum piscinae TaxID=2866724 RepID=A0A8J7K9E7_9NEIS|nr:MFS transporter [Chitinilyticum piscinae]MBE9607999.1 MFS transporter [Chitinilyticum piscinae]
MTQILRIAQIRPTSALSQRRPVVLRMLLASMIILVLAQGLNVFLTLAAQRNASVQTLATAIRISGHEQVFHIENAMRLGKPLAQMYGLSDTLAGLRRTLPFIEGVALINADGQLLLQDVAEGGTAMPVGAALASYRGEVLWHQRRDDLHLYLLPIHAGERQLSGFLVFLLSEDAVTNSQQESREQMLRSLLMSSALGLLLLFAATLLLQRCPERFYRRALFIAPFAAVLIAQGVFSWYNVTSFRSSYLAGLTGNVQRACDSLGREFERLLALGVDIRRFHGLDAPFQRMLDDIPELASVTLYDAEGRALFTHPRFGGAPDEQGGAAAQIQTPLRIVAADSQSASSMEGVLSARLSSAQISKGIWHRVSDAGTVALTSAIFVGELLILLAALMHRDQQSERRRRARPLLARTAAFTLLFAWALPLAIVPLHMAQLMSANRVIPAEILNALPVSAEMLFALLATLFAGRLADRHGWHWPFLAGTLICACGGLLSALSSGAGDFIAARGLVGLGYGLAWMGIQSHVYAASPPRTQMHAIASLVAGIFAGHLCGSATGGMLAEQFGAGSVFLLSAVLGLVPLLFALAFMRDHFRAPPQGTLAPASTSALRELLADRNYLALLALCVVPFSIVQVGLLYFALPLHLGAQGASPADTGRILMVYGLSVIYLGPLLGRWLGRFRQRKHFVVLAGLLGGSGLAALYLDAGLLGMLLAVFLLGIASSFGGPAQSSFALQLPAVQRAGKNRAMAIQRTADKLGQLLGPLCMGGLFALLGSQAGLSIAGLMYMLCAVAFWLLARHGDRTAASS